MWLSFAAIGQETEEISRWIKNRKKQQQNIRATVALSQRGGPNKDFKYIWLTITQQPAVKYRPSKKHKSTPKSVQNFSSNLADNNNNFYYRALLLLQRITFTAKTKGAVTLSRFGSPEAPRL